MANTINAGLIKEILHESAITSLGNVSAMLDACCFKVTVDPIAPRADVNVPLVTAASTALTNPSSFESGDSTAGVVSVTPAKIVCPIHATDAEMGSGTRAEWFIGKAMQTMQNALVDALLAPVTTGNFGTAVVDVAAASFATANLKTILAAAKDFDQVNLWLDGGHLAQITPTSTESFRLDQQGAYGFDRIFKHNRWDGAGTDVFGFCAGSNALAAASGDPYYDEDVVRDLDLFERVELPNGMPVILTKWVSRSGRAVWYALETMFGAAAGDTTAGKIIEGATN